MFILNEFFPIMFIKVIAIILVLLVEITLSADQQYEACEPRHCGDSLNVSFPFWIPNQHQSYCGHPGFEIACNVETPMIRVSNVDYLVRNISYEASSVLVVHSDAYLNESCPTPLHNISLNNAPFEFGPRYASLYFFYNCTSTPREYLTYPVPCATNASTSRHSYAAFLAQLGLEYLNASSQNCQSMVNAPVNLEEGVTFQNMASMTYTDILREGFLLNWGVARNNCTICETSGGRCGFERDEFICFCPDRPRSRSCSKGANNLGLRRKIVLALAIGIGGLLAAAVIFFIWRSKQSPTKSIIFWKRSNKAKILVEEFLKNYGSSAPKRYNYSDIKKITNSFKDKVGKGGFGFVYNGKLLDGRLVAVKLLNKAKGDGEEFINEIGSITRTSHVNVVSLLGFCFEGSKRALIYEFMPNGSLEKFIYNPNPLEAQSQLGWEMLYQITIGVARGLEYLHRGCNTRILHFDIKPHNILLDHDFTPKISDFGLAKLCLNKESVISMLDARGTAGYIAPEVFSRNIGGVSRKSDVYSFGMMVLEIVGRRKNINVQVDHTSEIYFPQWIYKRFILDADLELYGVTSQDETEIAKKMIVVALWCIQTNPLDRPSMSRVVEMLEGRNELLQIPPKPYLCSPPRSPVGSSNI